MWLLCFGVHRAGVARRVGTLELRGFNLQHERLGLECRPADARHAGRLVALKGPRMEQVCGFLDYLRGQVHRGQRDGGAVRLAVRAWPLTSAQLGEALLPLGMQVLRLCVGFAEVCRAQRLAHRPLRGEVFGEVGGGREGELPAVGPGTPIHIWEGAHVSASYTLSIHSRPLSGRHRRAVLPMKSNKTKGCVISEATHVLFNSGRGERIRTSGLYVPNVALYQAKLHPDVFCCVTT